MLSNNPVLFDGLAFSTNEESAPGSMLLYPVMDKYAQDGAPTVVAHILSLIPWGEYFSNVRKREC